MILAVSDTKRTGNWRTRIVKEVLQSKVCRGERVRVGTLCLHSQSHHRHVDVAQREVVHSKVRRDLYCHGGYYDCVIPELRVVQDISQANQGHILEWQRGKKGKMLVFELSFLAVLIINNAVGFPWSMTE